MTRCPEQVNVGAYVLDVLEPDERARMQRHLDVCLACRADVTDLAELPDHLATVGPDALGTADVVPTELAFRRLEAAAKRDVPWPRRHRALAVAAGVVLLLAAAGGAVAVRRTDGPRAPQVVTAASGAVHARAVLTPTHNGTRVVLTIGGVASQEQCRLVAIGRNGSRETASTWTATYEGDASVTGWLSIAPGDVDRFVIETLGGRTLLVLPPPTA